MLFGTGLRTGRRAALRALLADGGWHTRAKLLQVVERYTLPEHAFRRGYAQLSQCHRGGRSVVAPDQVPLARVLSLGYQLALTADLCKIGYRVRGERGHRSGRATALEYRLLEASDAVPA